MSEQELKDWLSGRPKWLQGAAKSFFDGLSISSTDLASLCIQEVLDALEDPAFVLPSGLFGTITGNKLRLISIQNIQGINALLPKKPLEFGDTNLSVVYGLNGSGKSGYVRILKHACGARQPGNLRSNIFAAPPAEQKCLISYEKDGVHIPHDWNAASGVVSDLSDIDIFDTMCGHVYAADENEVTYEPPVLSFISSLITISEEVGAQLSQRMSVLPSACPELPQEYSSTNVGQWYASLDPKISAQDITLNCEWIDSFEAEITELKARLAEKSPAEKAKHIRRQKQHLESLIKSLEENLIALSYVNCQKIIGLRKEISRKKKAAEVAACQVFKEVPLEGIGSDIWQELWEKARQYSEQVAYKETAFPNTTETARCVLCQQSLSAEARGRLQSFEGYIKGTLATEVAEVEASMKTIMEALPSYSTDETLREKLDACGCNDEGEADNIIAIFAGFRKRQEKLLQNENIDELPALPESNEWVGQARFRLADYELSAQKFDDDATNDSRVKLQARFLELQAKKWVAQQKKPIENEVVRLQKIEVLEAAKKLTNTTSLSKKKGELAKLLITEAFVQRFNEELKTLGAGRIRVELVKTKVSKGRVLHKLRLCGVEGCGLEDVLSEGEFRIITLAAFLADVVGKSAPAPFVFDDPISSLDLDYEEAAVRRLVHLAQNRQVIVFTHRLSLLGMLEDYSKKAGITTKIIHITQEPWGVGEPGDQTIESAKPKAVLNAHLPARLREAKKVYDSQGTAAYQPFAQSICTETRKLIERLIEYELLADVVQRHRRTIYTSKIEKLFTIKNTDCTFLDSMMTKYSRYEHLQSSEAPVALPDPDEIAEDIGKLKKWRDLLEDRRQ